MSAITQIKVRVHTGRINNAGTDGFVYLGICGREFQLSRADKYDFEQDTHLEYILGSGANVEQARFNNPTLPQLDTTDADRYPAYIRFEPTGNSPDWNLDGVVATIFPGEARYQRLGDHNDGANLWLGQTMGKFCYLRKA